MAKKISILFLFCWISVGYCQKKSYVRQDFNALSKTHKTLAVLPFIIRAPFLDTTSEIQGKKLQQKTYTFFKKQQAKMAVSLQPIEKTNAILKEKGITYQALTELTPTQIATLLGVDGLVQGSSAFKKTIQKEKKKKQWQRFFSINKGTMALKVSDKTTGKLLWHFQKKYKIKQGKKLEALLVKMLEKLDRRFPYYKKQ